MSLSSANRVELTPLAFLDRAARVFPDRTAIISQGVEYSYAEFGDHAQRLARSLAGRVGQGGTVATLGPNSVELLIAHFAVPLARAVLATVNTRLAVEEVAYILDHCGAHLLMADAEFAGAAMAAAAASGRDIPVVVWGGDAPTGTVPYTALLEEGSRLPPLSWQIDDEHAVISINYTSGTTGRPKGVEYTHRGAYLNAMGFLHHVGFDAETRYLWTLPMFHCNGWCTPWAVTAGGGSHIVIPAVREDAVWDAIDELGVSHLCGAPTVLTTIASAERAHPFDRPIRMITGGAPPSPAMIARLEALGGSLTHAYGLTEVYGPFTICEYQTGWDELAPDQRAERMARQGVPMIQSGELRIVDDEMQDVPADGRTIGEIVMRGNNVMRGYHRDPEATAEAFRGGWFHSGDLGVTHPDGYIEVKDRSKDIIISGGENISSIEVENALLSHPSILDAAVISAPDERWGERPIAYVVIAVGFAEEEVKEHLRTRIARFKVPDRILVIDSMPRTSTGKVVKRELRSWAGQTATTHPTSDVDPST